MKKIIRFDLIIICTLLFYSMISHALENQASPVGYWKTIDDVTGKPKAIVRIVEDKDKTLTGQVYKIFPLPGHDQNERCTECEGDKHNKRIVGLSIIEDLKPDEKNTGHWGKGSILDPKTGKVYHCALHVVDGGQKLSVRGYLGMPLFGRTQTWLKVEDPMHA